MIRLIWPPNVAEHKGVLVRTGRALHWAGLALGGPIFFYGMFNYFGRSRLHDEELACMAIGAALAIAGRLARYVLADE